MPTHAAPVERGLALTTGVTLAGLVLLAALATWSHPPDVALSNLAEHVGARVHTAGRVLSLDESATGWTRLRLADSNASVEAHADGPLTVTPGDVVGLEAIVEKLGIRIQLRIEAPTDVEVLRTWRQDHVPLPVVLNRPHDFAGTHLVTSGWTERVSGSMYLYDAARQVRVLTDAGDELEDAFVVVEGAFEYQPEYGRFRLRAQHVEPAAPP